MDTVALERRISRAFARAITDFGMLADGDRVMVCVSGGKDSYVMLDRFRELQKKAPVRFELKVVNVDQGHPGYPGHLLTDYMATEGYDFTMVKEDTYSIVTEKIPEGKTFCSLCSRLRRGILYEAAERLGCTKIALGHHRDDGIETFLLNLFYGGKLQAMPAKFRTDCGRFEVVRPLVDCAEADIAAFAAEKGFPILPCNLCGSQEGLRRERVAELLTTLERENPTLRATMHAALGNVRPSHLLDPEVRDAWNARPAHVRPVVASSREKHFEARPVVAKRRLPLVTDEGERAGEGGIETERSVP